MGVNTSILRTPFIYLIRTYNPYLVLPKHHLPTKKFLQHESYDKRNVLNCYIKYKRVYREKLMALRRIYSSFERCFILGNGPSLNLLDLSRLKHEVTFGVNGIFFIFNRMGFKPTFYVVEDHLVAEDRAEIINRIDGTVKLFPIYLSYCLKDGDDTIFFNHLSPKKFPSFSKDASLCTYEGATVTYTNLQLAFYLGFKKVYLIGVDFDYKISENFVRTNEYGVDIIESIENDPNHFHPEYFGRGYRWHDPQLHLMAKSFECAKKIYESDGRKIYNATAGGKLEIFERVDYNSLF